MQHLWPYAVAIALHVLSAVAGFVLGRPEGGFRFLVIAGAIAVLAKLRVSPAFTVVFALMLLVAGWAGVRGWYEDGWWVDVVIHFAATGATGAVTYLALARLGVAPPPGSLTHWPVAAVVLTVALGALTGVLWEFYEWFAREVLGRTEIGVGYEDTLLDLAMDLLGSLVAGVAVAATRPDMTPDPE